MTPPAPPPLTLTQLARTVLAAWRVLLAGSATGLLLGIAVAVGLPRTYTATASVRVDPVAVDPLATQGQDVDMAAEQRAASSGRVLGRSPVTVTVVAGSRLLLFAASDGSAGAAARAADAVARRYLALRSHDAEARVAEVRRNVRAQADSAADRATRSSLAVDLARARRLTTSGGVVVAAARTPRHADQPSWSQSSAAGVLLGLLVAVPVAAWRGRSSTPVGRWVVVDVDARLPSDLRAGVSAHADQVLVVRGHDDDLGEAGRWCERLRAVGVDAEVVRVAPAVSRSPAAPAS